MKVKCIVQVLKLLAIATLLGCSDETHDRLAASIIVLENMNRVDRVAIEEESNKAMLRDLKSATADSIDKPLLSYVGLLSRENDYVMRVFWIQDYPSPTAVKIEFGNGFQAVHGIHEIEHLNNLQEAKRGVIYHAFFRFMRDSPEAAYLKEQLSATIYLLNNDVIASNGINLSYVRSEWTVE